MTTNPPLDAFEQRLSTIRRHMHGLQLAIDALEVEMLAQQAPRTDAETAAQQALQIEYRQGPSEVKVIR